MVINFTTGGAPTMTIEERLQPALQLKPEVASLNMGSMNFGLYEMLGRYKEFKHDWERPYLAGSRRPHLQEHLQGHRLHPGVAAASNDTRFEIECYDIGHLYTAAHFLDRGLVKPPLFIQSVFGIRGGIGPHPEDVMHMKRTADRLFGDAYYWSVLGAGRNQMFIAAHVGGDGRQRARRPGGQPVARARPAREIERRAGGEGETHPRGARAWRWRRRTMRARC